MRKELKIKEALENTLVIFALLLANRRALVFQDYHLKRPFTSCHLWIEMVFWFALLCWVVLAITRDRSWSKFIRVWKSNWFLFPFLVLALLSLVWTNHFQASLYRVLALWATSIIAAYIGSYIRKDRFISLFVWCAGIMIISSYLTILFLPHIGKMLGHPYFGAWRGIFWHRNQLSTTMAIVSCVFIVISLQNRKQNLAQMVFYGSFYLASVVLVIFSRSLTGVVVLLGLHCLGLLWYLWLKFRSALRSSHYWFLAICIGLVLTVGFLGIDEIAKWFNKSGSWSGRIVLWKYLLSLLFSQHPLLGFGYGAIWNFHEFRVNLGEIIKWHMPILIGDNGYVDIWLHLGSLGLVLFLGVIFMAGIRFLRVARAKGTLTAFLPFLLVVFLLVANISFSLFLELESFFWMILVVMLFSSATAVGNRDQAETPVASSW